MLPTSLRPHLTGPNRARAARNRREQATNLSQSTIRPPVETRDNGDNATFDLRPMAFTKGLEHDDYGVLTNTADYTRFEEALTQPGPNGAESEVAFDVPGTKAKPGVTYRTLLDGKVPPARTWESPLAGVYYVEEGPDPGAIGIPGAPRLGSSELCAELAEVYAMALTRDMTFAELSDPGQELYSLDHDGSRIGHTLTVGDLITALNRFNWFNPAGTPFGGTGATLSTQLSPTEMLRRKRGKTMVEAQDIASLFRGSAPGVEEGDYLSKFMMLETVGYGAHTIDQRIFPARPGLDYMTDWASWLDVQNGANLKPAGAI